MNNMQLTIIAGPCSVDENNIKEIREIAQIEAMDISKQKKRAIAGTRIVGLKSRTDLDTRGEGMGMDFQI